MSTFINENLLQEMLAESPAWLNLKEPAVVVRELRVPEVGKIDLAAVGLSGRITLVECKLANNPEIRRSVVGQVFAYAAGLWTLSYDEFDSLFTAQHGRSLAVAVEDLAGMQDDWDEEVFRQNVAENLEQGRFDLVIAVDTITDELKLVVSYLNEHTHPEIAVLALELDYQAAGDVEIVVPKFYGEESAARKTRPSARGVWDEESLFKTLAQQCPEGVPVVRRLYDHAVQRGGHFSFGRGTSPVVTVSLTVGTIRAPVWRWNMRPPARWVLMFDMMRRRGVAQERVQRFLNRLHGISGLAEQFDGVEEGGRKRARIPVFLLAAPGVADAVVSALDNFLDIQE